MKIFVGTGQSNKENQPAYAWTPPSNLHVLNGNAYVVGTSFNAPSNTTIGHTIAKAAAYAKRHPDEDVYVINVGAGSQPIDQWLPGCTGLDMYAPLDANVTAGLALLGADKIDDFDWWGCESNYINGSMGTVVPKLTLLWQRLLGEPWFRRTTPFTITAVTERYSAAPTTAVPDPLGIRNVNHHARRWVEIDPSYRAFTDTSALSADVYWDLPDRIHGTGLGYYEMGELSYRTTYEGLRGRPASPIVKRLSDSRTQGQTTPIIDSEMQVFLRAGYSYTIKIELTGRITNPGGLRCTLVGPPVAQALFGDFETKRADAPNSVSYQWVPGDTYPPSQALTATTTMRFDQTISLRLLNVQSDGLFAPYWSQYLTDPNPVFLFQTSKLSWIEIA